MNDLVNQGTSLIKQCMTCKAKCCHNMYFTATVAEHDRIVASGAPDHFYKVTLEFKCDPVVSGGKTREHIDYYLLDYRKTEPYGLQPCPYLLKNKRCSIEAVKPDTCRLYPLSVDPIKDEFVVSFACPVSAPMISDEYLAQAREIEQRLIENLAVNGIDGRLKRAVDEYQDNGGKDLEIMRAQVTPPPASLAL